MKKKDYRSEPETKAEKHKRLLAKITDQAEAPDFYDVLNDAIECYTLNNTRDTDYSDICASLWELRDFFYLQILLNKK